MIEYKPEKCECCGQQKTYLLAIDKGTVAIVKQIARFIGEKGINAVHPRKEMEGRWLTSNQVGNLTRARAQGLIARIKGKPGNYVLTKKGASFLRGDPIPKFAILSKVTKHQIGYFEEEKYQVTVHDFNTTAEYWEGVGYDIVDGRVIMARPEPRQAALAL